MDTSVLSSYLISLGFKIDEPGLMKVKAVLKQVNTEVESHVTGITKLFVGMGASVAAAYVGVAAATAGLMDHVAQSDLGFQLHAMRMMMSTDAAKKLKIATDALGYSLDEIAWNPELRGRYMQLIADQGRMQGGLGGDFEKQMRNIRDIRFEFTRIQVELQYMLMGVVRDLGKSFGLDEGGMLRRLRDVNEFLQHNLPAISRMVADDLAPVLRDVKRLSEDMALAFVHFIGSIYSDDKLKTGKLNIDNVASAIGHVNESLDKFLKYVDSLIQKADAHPKILGAILGVIPGAVVGGSAGSGLGLVVGGLPGAAAGGLGGTFIGGVGGGILGEGAVEAGEQRSREASMWGVLSRYVVGISTGLLQTKQQIIAAIVRAANHYGIPPEIALAVARRESGFNEGAVSSKGARGIFQLMPDTAKQYGVNAGDAAGNIEGGVHYLADLYRKYGDFKKTLAAYNWGPGHIPVEGGLPPLPKETEGYISDVTRQARIIDVGGVNVYVTNPNASADDIYRAVLHALGEQFSKQTQRNIAQLSGSH